jgi:fructokinase
MRKIFCIGETVCDIIFRNFEPVAAKAGGSMLNTAVSAGRMKLPVSFISEYGNDSLGEFVNNFLNGNNIDTKYIYRYNEGKTSISLAFLNENNDASYTFYKDLPKQRLAIEIPDFTADDYLLFGSFYAINYEIRDKIVAILKKAKKAGTTIIYDPNFRQAHLKELPQLLPYLIENFKMADLVRASDEDLNFIFNVNNPEEGFDKIKGYCSTLIYTHSNKGVLFKNFNTEVSIPSKDIEPVSTIGAGDSFNAGLLYYLYSQKLTNQNINKIEDQQIKQMLKTGIDFATQVCLCYDNYISNEFAENYLKNRLS